MRNSKITYHPQLSIAENARLNQCSESNIRYYIQAHNINREVERITQLIKDCRRLYEDGMSAYRLAKITGYSINTVKKYWDYITTEKDVSNFNRNKHNNLTLRQLKDYYATHPSCTDDILRVETFSNDILEPACGGGTMAERIKANGYHVRATDIIDRGYGEGGVDFLEEKFPKGKYDIITNPPYTLCVPFIEKSIEIAKSKVAMLLPLKYLSSQSRYELFLKYPPAKVYVYIERICIAKNGDFAKYEKVANMETYAWYVWEKGYQGESQLKWLHNQTLNVSLVKKYKAIIFDFDDTLLYTSFQQGLFDRLRSSQRGSEENRLLWKEVIARTKDYGRYEGMDDVFRFIRENNIKTVIVTDAPKTRIMPAIKHFKIPVVGCVTRFECERKPSAVPILKGLELLECKPTEVISIGNQLVDYAASKNAGVDFAACEWGKVDGEWAELAEKSNLILQTPKDILQHIEVIG